MRRIVFELPGTEVRRRFEIKGSKVLDLDSNQTTEVTDPQELLEAVLPQNPIKCFAEHDYQGEAFCITPLDASHNQYLRISYSFGSCEECDPWALAQAPDYYSYSKQKVESLIVETLGQFEIVDREEIMGYAEGLKIDRSQVRDFLTSPEPSPTDWRGRQGPRIHLEDEDEWDDADEWDDD